MNRFITVFSIACLLLAGCKDSSNYATPSIEITGGAGTLITIKVTGSDDGEVRIPTSGYQVWTSDGGKGAIGFYCKGELFGVRSPGEDWVIYIPAESKLDIVSLNGKTENAFINLDTGSVDVSQLNEIVVNFSIAKRFAERFNVWHGRANLRWKKPVAKSSDIQGGGDKSEK